MTKTAVGLFENPGSVDKVVRELKAGGIPQKDVRVLREPREMAGSGVMGTPHTDFEVDLIRDLRAIGAVEADAEAYVRGVRRGGVMVFATGPAEKADAAAEIMNHNSAVEIEELSASVPHLPSTVGDDVAPGPIALSKLAGSAPPAPVPVCSCGESFTKDRRAGKSGPDMHRLAFYSVSLV